MNTQKRPDRKQTDVPFPPVPMVYESDELVWEYKLLSRNLSKEDVPAEDELNALGRDGWDLTGIFTDSPFVHMYFKRLKEAR